METDLNLSLQIWYEQFTVFPYIVIATLGLKLFHLNLSRLPVDQDY